MKRSVVTQEGIEPRSSRTLRRGSPGFMGAMGLLLLAGPVLAAASAEWTAVPNMAAARYAPTATPVSAGASTIQGRVLVTGGYNGSTCATSAQLFNPSTNAWSTTGGLKLGRSFHTATDFGDGTGRVFVAGGFTTNIYGQWVTQKSTEVFDPATGAFGYTTRYETQIVRKKPTTVAVQVSMNTARELFTATLLPRAQGSNGKILLAGGMYAGRNIVRTAELFDPATMTISPTGSMVTPYGRFEHDSVFLPPDPSVTGDQGKVLVVGGKDRNPTNNVWTTLGTAEVYDVATGTFRSVPMLYARARPRVVWMPSVPRLSDATKLGMALVVGGKYEGPDGSRDVLTCEWYDPSSESFHEGPSLQAGRMAHTLTSVDSGSFLVAGGWSQTLGRSTDTAEQFTLDPLHPLLGSFTSLSTMASPRQDHEAVALPDGRVLVIGGKPNVAGVDSYLNRAETYTRP